MCCLKVRFLSIITPRFQKNLDIATPPTQSENPIALTDTGKSLADGATVLLRDRSITDSCHVIGEAESFPTARIGQGKVMIITNALILKGVGQVTIVTGVSRAVGSIVVRASDSRPEGLGSMPDATKYPPSTHGFPCRNCGGGDREMVLPSIVPSENFAKLNPTVTCMVLKANDRRTSSHMPR
ncbi:hypothetical protein TNCV_1232101 [Trichonephila clavipes]|nr:hypothetical protein TNCV_1232101 [Trichonephila clavipes]